MNTSRIEEIINQHDPENDVHYIGPRVTWAEVDLAEAVLELYQEIAELKAQIKAMDTEKRLMVSQ